MALNDIVHTAGVYLETPLDFAFDHLCDPSLLGRWALGCMDLKPTDTEEVFVGRSLFDDASVYVEFLPTRDLGLIDYLVGDQDNRQPRISIRLVPGALCGLPDKHCAAAMTAWRVRDMTQTRWDQLIKTHELEVLLFKAQIETRFLRSSG